MNELKTYCREVLESNPELQDQVIDIYQMAVEEIEDGGSEDHEIALAIESIEQLKI